MWTTPMTNRTDDARLNYTDLNRIFGNINEIADTSLKTDWDDEDFLDQTTWESAIDTLNTKIDAIERILEKTITGVTYLLTYDNLNAIESVLNEIHDYGTILYFYDASEETYTRNYLPATPSAGDAIIWGTLDNKIYECGYCAKYDWDDDEWQVDTSITGWSVIARKYTVDYQFKSPILGINITNMDYCFYHNDPTEAKKFTNLESLIIPSTVISANSAYNQTNIIVAPTLPSGLKEANAMFYNCKKLTTISRIPSGVDNCSMMFVSCIALTGNIAFNIQNDDETKPNCWHMFDLTTQPITITDVNSDRYQYYIDNVKENRSNITIQTPEETD